MQQTLDRSATSKAQPPMPTQADDNGRLVEISARELVPGDVIALEAGGVESAEKNMMQRPPHKPTDGIFSGGDGLAGDLGGHRDRCADPGQRVLVLQPGPGPVAGDVDLLVCVGLGLALFAAVEAEKLFLRGRVPSRRPALQA